VTSDIENFICNRYGERLYILETKNIKNQNLFAFSSISAEYLQKIDFSISQGSDNMPKVMRVLSYAFCSKFHTLFSSAKILIIR